MISIVIPTYGRPDLLSQCLEALARNMVVPHETIVVDDGQGLSVADVVMVKHERNKGFASAINSGIRLGFVPKGYRFKGEFDPSKIHGSKRRTVQTRDWWLEQMFEAGMELDWKKYKEIKFDNEGLPGSDFRSGGVGWRGLDSVFVMKHKEAI